MSEGLYRLWPRPRRHFAELDGRRPFYVALFAELAFTAVLCLPLVSRKIGISWRSAIVIMGACIAGTAVNNFWLAPRARESAGWFHAQVVFDLLHQAFTALALCAATSDPKTPLWSATVIVACIAGAYQDLDASWAFLVFFVAAPLALIPYLLFSGADPGWSVVAPLVSAALSGAGYHVLAGFGASARKLREEQQRTVEELRRRTARLERDQLASDLHDSIGSALSLVRLYSDLIERTAGDPKELLRVSELLREAASEGLRDLRGLLDAIAPADATLSALGANLRRMADRIEAASDTELRLTIAGDPRELVDGPKRIALVRVFQEAVSNAIRHGRARRIEAKLEASSGRIAIEVRDDGCGFSPSEAALRRGLAGMRHRALHHGGALDVVSAPGAGTRIHFELPLAELAFAEAG